MSDAINADDLLAYHKATGCPLSHARRELMGFEPQLRERVLAASRIWNGKGIGLTDPIEQDPAIRRKIRQAGAKAERLVQGEGLGRCHAVWETQAQILWEEHGIKWYSPAQMNPSACFD